MRGLGRADEAEPLARRALQVWEASFGTQHEWTAWGLISLAEVRLAQGDADEAASHAERARRDDAASRCTARCHAVLATTLLLHGRALLQQGQPGDAESVLQRLLAMISDAGDEAVMQAGAALLAQARGAVTGR